MYVIRIIARADGTESPEAGRFISGFDPRYAGGIGFLTTTRDRHRAQRFTDQAAAFTFWKTETPTGMPLTAFAVSIEPHNQEVDPTPWPSNG